MARFLWESSGHRISLNLFGHIISVDVGSIAVRIYEAPEPSEEKAA